MPQPLAMEAAELPQDDVGALEELERASLLQLRTLQFDTDGAAEPLVGFRPFDARMVNETITTTYEGVLPGTTASNGLLEEEEDDTRWLNVGFDPCGRGVREGDHVVITSERDDECGVEGELEYEVVERNADRVRLAPIDEPAFADRVPGNGCFGDQPVSFEVRAADEWVVVGDTAGYFSETESAFGECVPRYAAEQIGSRVETGGTYVGPYYSFYMYPGFSPDDVDPVRDASFSFQVSSGFQSVLFPTCSSLGSRCDAGFFPAQVLWVPGLDTGTILLSPDPNDDFIHVRNLSETAAGYTVVR
jgi:hypothetical protein